MLCLRKSSIGQEKINYLIISLSRCIAHHFAIAVYKKHTHGALTNVYGHLYLYLYMYYIKISVIYRIYSIH